MPATNVLNSSLQVLSDFPASVYEALLFYHSGDQKVYFGNATTWVGLFAPAVTSAYAHVTDGTHTANASGGMDTLKIRTSNATYLGVTVTDNDATHGDNVLLSINEDIYATPNT